MEPMFQCGCMKNIVHTRHSVLDGLRVADIANIKLDLFCRVWVLCLKLMAHVILFLLITRENTDFCNISLQETIQYCITE